MCNILKPAKITIESNINGGFQGNQNMNFTKLRVLSLFLGCMLTGSSFASDSQLQLEIIPFDYADADMKEQFIAMMTDTSDLEMQKRFHYSQEELDEMVTGPIDEFQLFVCRITDGSGTICGFMECKLCDTVYFSRHPERGVWLSFTPQKNEGFVLIEMISSVGFISSLGVHKNYRGHGIAQAILNHLEQDCRNNGMRSIILAVDTDNEKAIKAYRKFGFEINLNYNENIESYTMVKLL